MDFDDAEIILIGVSRAGKTPTCVYLALHYGIRAANYPLTEEDLEPIACRRSLRPHRTSCSADDRSEPLHQIRQERGRIRKYAQLDTCRREVAQAEHIFLNERLTTLSTTHTSIEEIASKVLTTLGIHREMF
jgi:regulator of PEP synthase PpsR (kinase-PPPase family)